mmetsp:Transcript_13373/g.22238  ORF Transcript_13373/g.22238 Transcript_13373/m.22238 type:complete len:297 (-) Transcript_13373:93-983(-)
MYQTGATLSECVVPPLVPGVSGLVGLTERSSSNGGDADDAGDSSTTRSNRALRRLLLSTSVLTKSDGSALLELGHTKVLCSVHGPRSAAASSLTGGKSDFNAGGQLNCEVRLAPSFGLNPQTAVSEAVISLDGRGGGAGQFRSSAISLDEIRLSSGLNDAIAPSVRLDRLPKCVVDVFVLVLQSDGSVLPAAITAASLALADAGIELFDLVSSCSVAVVDGEETDKGDSILADPNESELLKSRSQLTLATLPNCREVTFWEQTGRISASTSSEAIELARDGCATVHKFMRESLINK